MKCEDCHYCFDGQHFLECRCYPHAIKVGESHYCHKFLPKHKCSEFERVIMEKEFETVYECVICKRVRIEVNRDE